MPGIPIFPDQASTMAWRVDAVFFLLSALTAFFTLLVGVLIVYFAIKYRRRSEDEIPEQTTGGNKLEIFWTVTPLFLAMGVFTLSAIVYIQLQDPPANAMEVYVVGRQWMWKVIHVDGQEEINELHIPVGRPVKLIMTSQDVIHSFFVPDFRVKQDVVPGRYTTMWFEATHPGRYHLFCAEYCGTEHSGMIGWVTAMEPSDYEAWLGGNLQTSEGGTSVTSPAVAGEALFDSLGCASCHRAAGDGPGPSLVGTFGKPVDLESGQQAQVDDAYIRESILNPAAKIVKGYQPVMPSYQGRASEDQLIQLLAYIKSLGAANPTGSGR